VAVPGAERAVVDPAKVRDYLLSTSHSVGRYKAAFFNALDYSAERPSELERDLRTHLASAVVARVEGTPFGQKYIIRGMIAGPGGRRADLVSVWVVLTGEDYPRFVTAYPGGAR